MKKLVLLALSALIVAVICQPVANSNAVAEDGAVQQFGHAQSETFDMEGSEVLLKIIEKKIVKLVVKCIKLGGCQGH